MQHHDAVVGENAGAFLEERIIEADADMLEHADRDNTVEGAAHVAIVERLEGGGACELAFLGALARDCELLLRKRDARGPGAADLRGIERKPAPTAADVKKPMPVFEEQLRGEVPLLGELGVVEAVSCGFEIGAAVLAVGVKEERIEAAVEVVVVGDVAPRPARDRPRRCRPCRLRQARGRDRAAPTAGRARRRNAPRSAGRCRRRTNMLLLWLWSPANCRK